MICNIFGSTPLHAAIKLGRTDVCKLLLSQGASVNAADNLNLIPFWIAAKNHDYICNLLLDHAVNSSDNSGKNLSFVVSRGKQLLSEGFLLSHSYYKWINPLLFAAASIGNTDVCNVLINQHGALVNKVHALNETPLSAAAKRGHADVCKFLLDHSAIVDSTDTSEQTPLHLAATRGHSDVCDLLINFGASVNKVDNSNKTALWRAADGGHVDVCNLLMDHGAIVDKADNKTRTPLHSVAIRGNIDVCKILINNGANVNEVDDSNKTPLFVAAKKGYADVCNLLLDHGADFSCLEKEIELLLDISSSQMKNLLLRWKDQLGKKFGFI